MDFGCLRKRQSLLLVQALQAHNVGIPPHCNGDTPSTCRRLPGSRKKPKETPKTWERLATPWVFWVVDLIHFSEKKNMFWNFLKKPQKKKRNSSLKDLPIMAKHKNSPKGPKARVLSCLLRSKNQHESDLQHHITPFCDFTPS